MCSQDKLVLFFFSEFHSIKKIQFSVPTLLFFVLQNVKLNECFVRADERGGLVVGSYYEGAEVMARVTAADRLMT